MPAEAGTQHSSVTKGSWAPAFAGVTVYGLALLCHRYLMKGMCQFFAIQVIQVAELTLHTLWPTANRGHTCARHFNQAQWHHERNELVNLIRLAGELEHKTIG